MKVLDLFAGIGGFTIGDDLDSTAGTLKLKGATGQITASDVLLDGGTIGGFELDSVSISSVDNSLIMSASGQITGSNVLFSGGEIGGFTLSSDELKSSNNNLRLKDSGQITGSDVLFDGGTIGGFSLGSNKLQNGLFSLNAQDGAGTIILAGTSTFGADGIHMAFNANAGGGSANTKFFVGNNNGSKIQYLNDILNETNSIK